MAIKKWFIGLTQLKNAIKKRKKPCLFVRLRKVRIFVCPPSDILLFLFAISPMPCVSGFFFLLMQNIETFVRFPIKKSSLRFSRNGKSCVIEILNDIFTIPIDEIFVEDDLTEYSCLMRFSFLREIPNLMGYVRINVESIKSREKCLWKVYHKDKLHRLARTREELMLIDNGGLPCE